jgi:hypothetical protein
MSCQAAALDAPSLPHLPAVSPPPRAKAKTKLMSCCPCPPLSSSSPRPIQFPPLRSTLLCSQSCAKATLLLATTAPAWPSHLPWPWAPLIASYILQLPRSSNIGVRAPASYAPKQAWQPLFAPSLTYRPPSLGNHTTCSSRYSVKQKHTHTQKTIIKRACYGETQRQKKKNKNINAANHHRDLLHTLEASLEATDSVGFGETKTHFLFNFK